MCFSAEADLVAGVALLPVAALSLREVRHVREVPFASLPLLFAAHQLVESLVWFGDSGAVGQCTAQAATTAYVFFALPVLPLLVPLAVLLLEPRARRFRVAPFVALGAVVAVYMAVGVLDGPIKARVEDHAIVYGVGLNDPTLWTTLYVISVVGPSVLSGYRSIVAFGVLNLLGLLVVGYVYLSAFASLWCVFAALSSVLVYVHMRGRRRYSDDHRLRGASLIGSAP